MKASPCHHTPNANNRHHLWEIETIIGVKSNIIPFNYVCILIGQIFCCGRMLLTDLNTPILKVWCSASRGHNHLTHWGRDKMAAIFQTTFSNAFSWMKMFEFRLRFHWSLFPRVQLTIFVPSVIITNLSNLQSMAQLMSSISICRQSKTGNKYLLLITIDGHCEATIPVVKGHHVT